MAWDVATNQQKVVQNFFSPSDLARISLDGQTLVNIKRAGKRSFHLQISDLTTGKLKAKERFSRKIFRPFNIALSRNFMIGSTSKRLTVWNLQTAKLEAILDEEKEQKTAKLEAILDEEKEQMSHLVVSPDGKLLAGIISDSDNRNPRIKVLQRP